MKISWALIVFLLLALPGAAVAEELPSKTWIASGFADSDGSWNVGTNWDPEGVPGVGDVVLLPDTSTRSRTITVDAAATVAGIQMPQTTGGLTNEILLAADLTTGSFSQFNTSLGPSRITIPAGHTLTVGDGDVSTDLPSVYGTGTVRKVGTGTMTTGLGYNNHVFHGEWLIEDGVFYTTHFPDWDKLTVMAGATESTNISTHSDSPLFPATSSSQISRAFAP